MGDLADGYAASMNTKICTSCANCSGHDLFQTNEVSSGGGYAPNYLPGLGSFMSSARFTVVVCRDCGLTRFFASSKAREKLATSKAWAPVR